MISIPSPDTRKWKAAQNSEALGNLIRTKNISLDQDGLLALAKRAIVLYSLSDDAGFGSPIGIETDGTYAYVMTTDGHFFVIDLTSDTFSILEASSTRQPAIDTDSDLVIFNNKVHVTGGTDLNSIGLGQGQTWTNPKILTDLDDTVPHPLCAFENRKTMLVGDGNTVRQYDTSYTRDTTNELVIPEEFIVTSMRYRLSNVYIGTRHRYGGEARYFVWNGAGASAGQGYGCGADWIYSQSEFEGGLAVITSTGQLRSFTGSGFSELAALPCYYQNLSWGSTAANTSLVGRVASRGMRTIGNVLYINLDGALNRPATVLPGKYLPEQPSGLWCFKLDTGLYHKAGYNYGSKLALTPSDLNSSALSFATPHQALTGDPVLYTGTLTGLTSGQVYYAIPGSTTTTQLALSPADAYAGRHVAITGTIGSDKCYFDQHESAGETSITSPGGVCGFGRNFPNPFYGSEVLFGGSAIDETQTAKGVLMSLGMSRNVGSFVLPKVYSKGVKDTFKKLTSFFEGMNLDTDALVVKYRTAKKFGLPTPLCFSGSAAWTGSTTFTIDSTLKDVKSIAIGDEIEVVEGAGAGYTAHVAAIDDQSSATYTYTIDETMPVSSGSFDFIADNWKKVGSITKDTDTTKHGFADSTLKNDLAGKWIEFKAELRGRGVMIEETQVLNTPHN